VGRQAWLSKQCDDTHAGRGECATARTPSLTLSAAGGGGSGVSCSYSTSALLGTYAASMGDRYGHRACIAVYGVIYSVSCATMHSGNFWVLMFGRVCGGVAYSLLYSSCVPRLLLSVHPSLYLPPSPTRVVIAQDSSTSVCYHRAQSLTSRLL